MTAAPEAFDLTGSLPHRRTTLIEASAGTGKTYALAALAVRYVAEQGLRVDQILLVTFTRAATAELRGRIRERLREAEAHLAAPRPEQPVDDPVLDTLDACDATEREQRRLRLADAVRDFDTATISTIHGFCSQVRAAMGVLTRDDGDVTAVTSESRLIAQACADLYFEGLAGHLTNPFGSRKLANVIELVTKARTLTDSIVEADSADPADLRTAELVRRAADEVDARLRRQGGLSYDSLLVSVRTALRSDPTLVSALRSQVRVAMIDEFQDTDPVQWEIFRTLFAPDDVVDRPTLVLVGDPKQAIYSFRGGDVYTYLDARHGSDQRVLATNQRSDPRVLEAMNALGGGQVYGEDEIAYIPVQVAERNRDRSVVMADGSPAAGLVVRSLAVLAAGGKKKLDAASVKRLIGNDLASVAHELLTDARVPTDDGDRSAGPRDIAVLVGSTADAGPMADALRAAGIPCVLRLRDDVADSPAADQWRTLLHALDRPASTMRATAAALTWFVGWPPEDVAAAIDAESGEDPAARRLVALQHELSGWADSLTDGGMPALFGVTRRSHDMVRRLLTGVEGERRLTDLEHLAELIHTEAGERGRGLTAGSALAILDSLGGTPDDEIAADAAQRRIESDADAVQILTIHGSKGLEFPFVLVPTLWSGGNRVQGRAPYAFYDADRSQRVIDVSTQRQVIDDKGELKVVMNAEAVPEVVEEVKRQNCGDQHRLTYVALTRARHQTVAWWSPGSGHHLTGLARLLFGAPGLAANHEVDVPVPTEQADAIRARVASTGAGAAVRVHDLSTVSDPPDLPPLDLTASTTPTALAVATLGRRLARSGKVWSFSSLAAGIDGHGGPTASAPPVTADPTEDGAEDRAAADEAEIADDIAGDADAQHAPGTVSVTDGWSAPSPFDAFRGGKDFGNLVHHLFEKVDLHAAEPARAIAELLDRPTGEAVSAAHRESLPAVLAEVIRTPLGPAFGGIRLADLHPPDHLDELDFHLPVAPDRPVSAGLIGSVIADHLPPDDLLRPWATGLAHDLRPVSLQGFLKGSIDLTLRFATDDGLRYSVVDYKTNNLTPTGQTSALAHYRRERMAQAMAASSYALQAVIYTVALHRYLRWRVAGYDPATHLGPVGYLFVRGMAGPDTPTDSGTPAGVFTWALPSELVVAVSDLFAGAQDGGDA